MELCFCKSLTKNIHKKTEPQRKKEKEKRKKGRKTKQRKKQKKRRKKTREVIGLHATEVQKQNKKLLTLSRWAHSTSQL